MLSSIDKRKGEWLLDRYADIRRIRDEVIELLNDII